MRAGGTVAVLAMMASPALANPGAAAGAPMQPGGWGQGGWQAGQMAHPMPPQPMSSHPMPMHPMGGHPYHPGPGSHMGYGPRLGPPPAGYRRLERGGHVPKGWRGDTYVVRDWNRWGLREPGPGMRWMRFYDDAALIDAYGRVVDIRYDYSWGGPQGYDYAEGGYDVPPPGPACSYAPPAAYPVPGSSTRRVGPNTTVTTTVTPMAPPVVMGEAACGGYYAPAGSIVTVTPGTVTTTTTTTTSYRTVYRKVAVRKRAYRPIRSKLVRRDCNCGS